MSIEHVDDVEISEPKVLADKLNELIDVANMAMHPMAFEDDWLCHKCKANTKYGKIDKKTLCPACARLLKEKEKDK